MAAAKGNQYAKGRSAERPWTNELKHALAQYKSGDITAGKALRRIADGVVKRAIEGDNAAIKEIAERLDGKPVQPLSGEIDSNITIEVLRFVSRDAGTAPE